MSLETFAFDYDPAQLGLDDTLASGQVFRWRRGADGAWTGIVGGQIIRLQQDGARVTGVATPPGRTRALIHDLFQLNTDLATIKEELLVRDPELTGPITRHPGLRLMRQDPEECLLSFVCSTANSVPRIAIGIARLSEALGRPLPVWEGQTYYAFPTAAVLAAADPAALALRTGLGYRTERLVRVAQQLVARPPGWLHSLRGVPYSAAHAALTELYGVGAKIADCVCLLSLDHPCAVPVDTHVWQIAQLHGLAPLAPSTANARRGGPSGLTAAAYRHVGATFRARYGPLAGYAENWLFYSHFIAHWGGASPLLTQ